jgi:threonyl-tRNA synthetase
VTIGPEWTTDDNGFYCDFHRSDDTKFTDADLKPIKKAFDRIVKKNFPITVDTLPREEVRRMIEELNEPFKLEMLDGMEGDTVAICRIGDEWWNLCTGPQLESTRKVATNAIKLMSVAGAYWQGDQNREMLQRITATAWENKAQLKEYGVFLEEAKRRDHRILGKKLDLFSIQEDAGGGLVFWHPKGSVVRRLIEDYLKEKLDAGGYDVIFTPHVANINLWKTSGHFDFYKDDMFDQMAVEDEEYQLKPTNCPFHCLMYKDTLRSYRDLPLRWAEFGTVYRYEASGSLHGLFRVRGFTQDDAHIFCLASQLQEETVKILTLTEEVLERFGFTEFEPQLSTRPDKSVGDDAIWEQAEGALTAALEEKGWDYVLNEGDGAFYGPKIDFKIVDAIGRKWQLSTCQCDFNLPDRFDMQYVADDGERKRPIMLHRAIFGSIERFFGILIESCAGELPLWLTPVQMRLLPVTESAAAVCLEVQARCKAAGLRVEVDPGRERLAKQIRTAQQDYVPLFAVVGEREVQDGTLAVRSRQDGDLGVATVDSVMARILHSVDTLEPFTLPDSKENDKNSGQEVFAQKCAPITVAPIPVEVETAARPSRRAWSGSMYPNSK